MEELIKTEEFWMWVVSASVIVPIGIVAIVFARKDMDEKGVETGIEIIALGIIPMGNFVVLCIAILCGVGWCFAKLGKLATKILTPKKG